MGWKEAIETGGVAVVTGAAGGIGLAACERLTTLGLAPLMVDVDADALEAARAHLLERSPGLSPERVRAVVADVADADAVARLADLAFADGEVAVLMNNAGIAPDSGAWREPAAWGTIIDTNLFGVVNGLQAFVPRMLEAGRPAAIVNTGSKQGITTPPGNPAYNVSKAGVKVVTEQLAHELREAGAPLSAHLFVPGFVWTGMTRGERTEKPDAAWTPAQTIEYLFGRLEVGDFYVLCPDNDVPPERDRKRILWAAGDIVENRPALSRWDPAHAESFAVHERQPDDPPSR